MTSGSEVTGDARAESGTQTGQMNRQEFGLASPCYCAIVRCKIRSQDNTSDTVIGCAKCGAHCRMKENERSENHKTRAELLVR